MWLNEISNLCIYINRYVNIITSNTREGMSDLEEMQEPKSAWNHQECEKFLNSKAVAIQTLKVQGDVKEVQQINLEYLYINMKPFRNLKKLIFHQTVVTDEDIEVIAHNCRQLRSLSLIKCFCEHLQDIVPGVNINMEYICKIQGLQELAIQPARPPGTIRKLKLEYVFQLLDSLMQLKHLNLQDFTLARQDEEQSNASYQCRNIWPIETLNIGHITWEFWSTFTEILKYCPALQDLAMHGNNSIIINIKMIDILRLHCKNLKALKLHSCEIDVEDFCPLQGLQTLTLNSCRGLTFNNLQQILGGLKLKTFNLINTRVFDVQNYIYTAPTLETVTIDTVHSMEISEMFQRSLNSFSNLLTLRWLQGDINHNWIIDKCPQLRQFHITNPFHLARLVLNLKSLTDLTITTCTGLSWSLLKMLLFDVSLKRLNIFTVAGIVGDSGMSQVFLLKPTTLEFITIPYKIFLDGLKVWLELLNVNQQKLCLMIYGLAEDVLNVTLWCLLFSLDVVRQRSERIKICGFKLDLEDFENSTIFREIARARINTRHYKASNRCFTLEL